MTHFFTALLTVLLAVPALAQSTFSIRGRVLDKVTGETLPGATVQVSGGQNTGVGADADGSYKISNLAAGTYAVQASFVGYKSQTQTVKITTQSVVASFGLGSDNASLGEVQVVAAQAQERETPVAFSAVNEVKLRETLSNRDLPMILNETPGVYATQAGGGTGDSRINVRGFDQRNVAVLINGVPVNDMENGNVFWSNWDLGDVTKSLQVQRGLSASKIAVPSVGGTINVLTKGFDDKRSVLARVETGSNNYQKYSLMLSSGQLKGDWAFTVYGSRRTSDGWVDKAFDDAYTYFGTVSKRAGRHSLSLTGLGSPQRHGQRSFANFVGIYSDEKAREIGVKPLADGNRGFKYNPYWGLLDRYSFDGNGNKVSAGAKALNERTNFYHKPQVNFNDLWQATDKLFVSTVLYASYGTGGGSSGLTSGNSTTLPLRDGQTDFQKIYDDNIGLPTATNPNPNPTRKATAVLINSVNSHRWYGFVVGGDYLLNDQLTLSAGVDGRKYTGLHYREIRDLLGADYAVAPTGGRNQNADPAAQLQVGDKLGYNYDGKTQWLGGYSQLEYKTPLLSAVVSGTLSRVAYQRIDYFQPQQPDGRPVTTGQTRFTGYSVKAGANYNLTEHDNIFANVGYNSKVPFFNLLYNNAGRKYDNVKPEGISSAEIGYGISYPSLKVTLNAYYTLWSNKTTTSFSTTTGEAVYSNVRNVSARHAGVELSVAQEISRRLQLNAAISLGDWRWTGRGLLNETREDGTLVNPGVEDQPVFLNGVHVGDAAQNQFQMGLRYEPFRGAYIRPSFLLFTKYYADFNPETIRDPAISTDSYRLPTSRNLDLHLGYELKPLFKESVRLGFRGSILNVLDQYFFTDVSNRSNSNAADLGQLQAFFNRGRTFTLGLSVTL
ncbi:TonB-dependent receptor [Hymenobacter sp.]|uniref:TonB-dependent receptor n=1 Tax=Hymenobacter sp. TaxID=1898978 RepID=UPI00286A35F9|nr:TonB-dependent receptor [Hymenobacter sp.]